MQEIWLWKVCREPVKCQLPGTPEYMRADNMLSWASSISGRESLNKEEAELYSAHTTDSGFAWRGRVLTFDVITHHHQCLVISLSRAHPVSWLQTRPHIMEDKGEMTWDLLGGMFFDFVFIQLITFFVRQQEVWFPDRDKYKIHCKHTKCVTDWDNIILLHTDRFLYHGENIGCVWFISQIFNP